ncbi:MAG TPA: hypothetical protein VL501_00650 [Pyrinomonadaceae bacterium]|nr:hypothetical protein [Pyrinomonadaceae bacterium]
MSLQKLTTTLLLMIVPGLLTACGGKDGANNANTAQVVNANTADVEKGARTTAEELGNLVRMPFEAEDVAWKQSKDQKKLTAVIRFDPEDTQKLAAECEKFGPPQNATVDAQSWFPDELTAQSDLHGDQPLSGKSYPANPFFQDPYNSGRVVRIDGTDFYVLELTSAQQ